MRQGYLCIWMIFPSILKLFFIIILTALLKKKPFGSINLTYWPWGAEQHLFKLKNQKLNLSDKMVVKIKNWTWEGSLKEKTPKALLARLLLETYPYLSNGGVVPVPWSRGSIRSWWLFWCPQWVLGHHCRHPLCCEVIHWKGINTTWALLSEIWWMRWNIYNWIAIWRL